MSGQKSDKKTHIHNAENNALTSKFKLVLWIHKLWIQSELWSANLSILDTGSTLASIRENRQLISRLSVFDQDSGINRIVVPGNRFCHVQVPGWPVISEIRFFVF